MKGVVICLSLLLLPASLLARKYGDFHAVTFHGCYDGDTCTFSLPGLHPLIGDRISVRLRGIDTPEIRGKCDREKELATAARDLLTDLLTRARSIDLLQVERGKYFRILATVTADGQDVGALLMAQQLARPYTGGRRAGWCD